MTVVTRISDAAPRMPGLASAPPSASAPEASRRPQAPQEAWVPPTRSAVTFSR